MINYIGDVLLYMTTECLMHTHKLPQHTCYCMCMGNYFHTMMIDIYFCGSYYYYWWLKHYEWDWGPVGRWHSFLFIPLCFYFRIFYMAPCEEDKGLPPSRYEAMFRLGSRHSSRQGLSLQPSSETTVLSVLTPDAFINKTKIPTRFSNAVLCFFAHKWCLKSAMAFLLILLLLSFFKELRLHFWTSPPSLLNGLLVQYNPRVECKKQPFFSLSVPPGCAAVTLCFCPFSTCNGALR